MGSSVPRRCASVDCYVPLGVNATSGLEAGCEDAALPVHPEVSRRLALRTRDGKEAIAWFLPRGAAADELVEWLQGRNFAL